MTEASPQKRVMIVTGEASGDIHGAKVMEAVRQKVPDVAFLGVGGQQMRGAGCEILVPTEDLSVMGIVEVVGHLPVICRSLKVLKDVLYSEQRPDALVLIDSPEFNLRLAKHAKRAGVPVLYFVSPQVWAWRRGRVKKIAAIVDKLAAIFPFEPELYRGEDIDVRYVGHPLLDEFRVTTDRETFCGENDLDVNRPIVGIFPGSRRNELKYILDTLVETAQRLVSERPDLQLLVPVASTLSKADIVSRFPQGLPITFIESDQSTIYDVANACDAIVTVSGTVTLQIALVGTPMVILYKLSPLSYEIGKRMIRVDHIGLANIVADKRAVTEYIQHDATSKNLADEAMRILEDPDYASRISQDLSDVQEKLGDPGCSDRVADMLLEMMGLTTPDTGLQ